MSGTAGLRSLPTVELHRHLDGSVRISTIHEISLQRGMAVGTREELRARAVIDRPPASLEAVLACFRTQQEALW